MAATAGEGLAGAADDSAVAAAPVPGEAGMEPGISAQVSERWFELRAALAAGGGAPAEEKLAELRKLRDSAGLVGLPTLAHALVADGFQVLDAGNESAAEERFRMALELDPANADGKLGLAAIEAQTSALSPQAIREAAVAVRRRATHLASAPYAWSNWLLLLGGGLLAAGLLAIVALTIAKQALLRHDVEELLKGRRIEGTLAQVIGWVVLALPLLLTFDLYWACLFWAVVIWAYAQPREQVVLGIALVLAALALPCATVASRLLSAAGDPYLRAASTFADGLPDAQTEKLLEEHLAAEPDSADGQLLLGLLYEKRGDPRRAIELYRRLSERGGEPAVLNNLANVYYRLEEKDRAFEYWKKALERDATFAPAHYNLGVYYFDSFEFDNREEHFNKARSIDPAGVDLWVAAGSGVVDAGIDRAKLWKRLLEPAGATPQPLGAALVSPQLIAAGAALILGLALARRRKAGGVASACVRCGKAFCPACATRKERADYCLQCVHLFIRKDGVSPQMRADKVREIAHIQTLRKVSSTALALVAPGTAQLYRGKPLLGLVLLVLFCLPVAAWLYLPHGLMEPGFVARAASALPAWLALIPAAVVWLAGNLNNLLAKD